MFRLLSSLKKKQLKAIARWLILGAVLFFLAKTLSTHWQDITTLRLDAAALACLAIALGVTLFAHIFAGYVWAWILNTLSNPVSGAWGAHIYLKTNIAKYLPGNVWHFYGRIAAAKQAGIAIDTATLSVLLEPLLMAAAACILAIVELRQLSGFDDRTAILQGLIPIAILSGVHPRVLNLVLRQLGIKPTSLRLQRYPLIPLLGELGFLGLRSLGFIATFLALRPISLHEAPLLIGTFAWAWLAGFVTPGLPGGIGVFEAIMIALLNQQFPSAQVVGAVALYRLVNTLAEGLGAGLVVLDEHLQKRSPSA